VGLGSLPTPACGAHPLTAAHGTSINRGALRVRPVKSRLRHHFAGTTSFAGNQLKPADFFQLLRATACPSAVLGDFAQHNHAVIFDPAQLRLGALECCLSCGGE